LENLDNPNSVILEAEGLSKAFKGLLAVDQYGLKLNKGEILAVIGPNGAGKTTLFNLLTGHLRPTRGTVRFLGLDITRQTPEIIAHLGMARTFQNIRLFSSMSVLENVVTAQQIHEQANPIATVLNSNSFRKQEHDLVLRSMEHLALFNLEDLANVPATSLSYGDQRRLEIARALSLQPKLLLMDEPTAGMSLHESMNVLKLIRSIREKHNLTIIIVEHNMPVAMQLCDRMQVLSNGQIIAEGTPEKIRNNPLVIEAYLGKAEENA